MKESAGKKKGKATSGRGNPYLARVLGEAARCDEPAARYRATFTLVTGNEWL